MLIIDSREKSEVLKKGADEVRLLAYDKDDKVNLSFDALIERPDGTQIRVERKRFADFEASWVRGGMERQLEAVDLLIVEYDASAVQMESPAASDRTFEAYWAVHNNARRHLALLCLSMPVIVTNDELETLSVLRFLEQRPDLVVRANKVKGAKETTRRAILRALPGVNPDRSFVETGANDNVPLHKPMTVGDSIERIVDWKMLEESLNLGAWRTLPGMKHFGDGRAGRIRRELRASAEGNEKLEVN